MRRIHPATLIASLALFVALGGPATAASLFDGKNIKKGTVTTKQIKDHSLGLSDLSAVARTSLRSNLAGSVKTDALAPFAVTGDKVADDTLTSREIAPSAVTPSELAPNAVSSDKVLDGSLTARDLGDFGGTLSLTYDPIALDSCQAQTSTDLTPIVPGADLTNDVILVTLPPGTPSNVIVASAKAASRDQITVDLCNLAAGSVSLGTVNLRYLAIDD